MNPRPTPLLAAAILGLTTLSASAADKWPQMDYGRFLSATYQNTNGKSTLEGAKAGSAANKGVAVKLGPGGEAAQLFDTDLVRMAGGWTGGWVERRGVDRIPARPHQGAEPPRTGGAGL